MSEMRRRNQQALDLKTPHHASMHGGGLLDAFAAKAADHLEKRIRATLTMAKILLESHSIDKIPVLIQGGVLSSSFPSDFKNLVKEARKRADISSEFGEAVLSAAI